MVDHQLAVHERERLDKDLVIKDLQCEVDKLRMQIDTIKTIHLEREEKLRLKGSTETIKLSLNLNREAEEDFDAQVFWCVGGVLGGKSSFTSSLLHHNHNPTPP